MFFGGLLTTCGLTYFGKPGRDGNEDLGLHGRYSALPAVRVSDLSRWEGNEYLLEATGTVEDAVLFGDKLRLTRFISTAIGSKNLRIRDRVENFGSKPSPFLILYHMNAGFPLLDQTSELIAASRSAEPYDDRSARGLAEVGRFAAPQAEFEEMNFLHTMAADERGFTRAALINKNLAGGLGLALRYQTASLRAEGRLPMIAPGETHEMELEISVLEGGAEIDAFAEELAAILRTSPRIDRGGLPPRRGQPGW